MVMPGSFKQGLLWGLFCAPAALFGGCSLTSIVDVRAGECPSADDEGDRRCQEVLNPEHGFYDGCAAFKCVEKDDYFQCQPVTAEICDGLDNDCDYLIDEPSSGQALLKANSKDLATGVSAVASLSLAESEQFARSLYLQESKDSLFQIALDGESASTTPVSLKTQEKDPDPASQSELSRLQDGCYPAASEAPGNACTTEQTVAAAGENLAFFAYVNGQGCTSGELRVGIAEQGNPAEFIDRGLGARAPSYRGVGTFGSRCSDNGSSACGSLKGQTSPDTKKLSSECGVSQPAIAALPDQALVAYLGSQLSATSCPQEETNVLSLAIHDSHSTFDSTIYWGNPSGDGVPDVIGKTKSGLAPSVTSAGKLGFIVAHGKSSGGIRLVWVPAQAPPKKVAGTTCPDGDCDSREGVETLPLSGVLELSVLGSDSTQLGDGISVSLLELGEDKLALLLTWVEGCALMDGNLNLPAYAQLVHLDISSGQPEILTEFPVVSLGKTKAPPLAVSSSDDFVVPGLSRNGQKAKTETAGGFFALTQGSALNIVRIAAFDGAMVDPNESISAADLEYLIALKQSTVVAHDAEAGTLSSVTIACK